MSALLAHSPIVSTQVAFLRDRCVLLQRALVEGGDPGQIEAEAFDGEVLRRWTTLLVPAQPWPPIAQLALEELHLLQARVVERIARGGVADISPEVESLVQALLVDNLQRATDRAVMLIA